MHQKLYHLTTADYEDFVNIVCSARAAFQITPDGNTQFKEWLQSIRRYAGIIRWYRTDPQVNPDCLCFVADYKFSTMEGGIAQSV
jgi:hypothetical protein